jgi:hypothetical protein
MNTRIDLKALSKDVQLIKVSDRLPVRELSDERIMKAQREGMAQKLGQEIIDSKSSEEVIIHGMSFGNMVFDTEDMAEIHLRCYVLNPRI